LEDKSVVDGEFVFDHPKIRVIDTDFCDRGKHLSEYWKQRDIEVAKIEKELAMEI
jgi:hypothetical protein